MLVLECLRSFCGKNYCTQTSSTKPLVLWASNFSLVRNLELQTWVVATQLFFIFTPIWGRWTHFDVHIFQMGWFNHQLEIKGEWFLASTHIEAFDSCLWWAQKNRCLSSWHTELRKQQVKALKRYYEKPGGPSFRQKCKQKPDDPGNIGFMGMVYLPTWMVDFLWKMQVKIYNRPMDAMGWSSRVRRVSALKSSFWDDFMHLIL